MPGKLTYFDLGGRSEGIRSMLAHANHDYEDNRITPQQFGELKMAGHFPLGSAPIWEEDGMCIPQSSTILRGLGIRLGYYSNDSETCWNIDSLVDFCEDMMGAIPAYTAPLLSGGVPNEAIADQWVNKSWRKMVTVLEGRLAGHGKPFLAGTDRPTIADFKAFQHVTNYLKGNGCKTPQPTVSRVEALIADHTHYARWCETMSGELSAYLRDRPARPF